MSAASRRPWSVEDLTARAKMRPPVLTAPSWDSGEENTIRSKSMIAEPTNGRYDIGSLSFSLI
jgi:hypothetical protein